MRRIKLGDCLCMIKNGANIAQRKDAKGYPITRIETLSNDKFNRDRLGYADIFDVTPYSDYILDNDDLLMSHINSRDFLGRCVLYKKQGDEVIIHGMNLLRLKTNEDVLDPHYAYYFFQTKYFKKCIQGIRKDAINQSSIAISDIVNIEFELPSLEYQKKVASILYEIDNVIENNAVINEELETIAKQLYDYWFIQFDFPDNNGNPYKSSGGRMVWNEDLKRDIPEGWYVKKLKDFFHGEVRGTEAGSHLKGLDYCPIDELPIRKMSFANGKSWEEAKSSLQLYDKKDILIGAMRVYFHRCCIASKRGVTRSTTLVLKPKDEEILSYLYQLCNEERTFEYATKVSTGTQQPYVTWESLGLLDMLYPNKIIIKKYCEMTNKIVDCVLCNVQAIEESLKLRSYLLPLLMNGQVTIKDQWKK